MDQLRFLLINPTRPLWAARDQDRPRGPRVFRFSMLPSLYVAAAMPDWVETRILDEDLEPVDYHADVDLVGLSFMTFNAPRAYEIADRFRARGVPVIMGGYHPTFLPAEALEHADAVCVGDAEPNVPRMLEDLAAGRLQPLYQESAPDLAGLPIPDRSLLRRGAYITPDVLQATRGCPYRCRFCSIAAFHHGQLRTRPVEEVIAELKTLGHSVIFMDDNIIGNREYARELFAAMIPLGKRWFSQCGLAIGLDPELLELARRSGCRGLFIGFESLSQENLAGWRKQVNRGKDYLQIVANLHRAGIGVFAGFVFGSDHDGPDVFRTTLDFLFEANVETLQATRLTPFPGTPLFDELDGAGRIFDRDWSHYDFAHVVFQPTGMSVPQLHHGTSWLLRQFYGSRSVGRRLWKATRYLEPGVLTKAVLPLNLGYRHRLSKNGTFEQGRIPPAA